MAHQTMGDALPDRVVVRGRDLTRELLSTVSFTDLIHLELQAHLPDEAARDVLDAVLVALTEHGLTPTAMAARMTDFGAPGALQGAVAAGLLGCGERFLGALDEVARTLQEWPAERDVSEHARQLVARAREQGARLAGFGHPTHSTGDPRTLALREVADRTDLPTHLWTRMEAVQTEAEAATGRCLPLNVDGAAAVLLTGIGVPWQVCRGIALVARTAGLVGHLWDEHREPTSPAMWEAAVRATPYTDPEPIP